MWPLMLCRNIKHGGHYNGANSFQFDISSYNLLGIFVSFNGAIALTSGQWVPMAFGASMNDVTWSTQYLTDDNVVIYYANSSVSPELLVNFRFLASA